MDNENNELPVLDGVKFLSEIESLDSISKKFKLLDRVLNQDSLVTKNLKDEMKKKGFNAGVSQDFDYVPVEIVEHCLRQVFLRQVDFIIKNSYRDLNTFIVHSRIQYKDPITRDLRTIDGIGAKAIQQDRGANIDSFNSTMKANGLELAVGIAYSRSIKNAAKKLGKLFGSDLNRDEETNNIFVYNKKVLNG